VDRPDEPDVLIALRRDLRARRVRIHLLAALLATGLCWVVSAVPLPSVQGDDLGGEAPSLAYGYLYLPLLLAPIASSFLEDPLADVLPRTARRRDLLQEAWTGAVLLTMVALCAVVGARAGGPDAAAGAAENAIWTVAALSLARMLLGPAWAAVAVVAYGALGLFLPPTPGLLIDRTPSIAGAVGGLVVLAALRVVPFLLRRR